LIGGEHYLPFSFVANNFMELFDPASVAVRFFASGRDAAFALLQHLAPRRIWYPDFLCQSLYEALARLDRPLLAYPVGEDLEASTHWVARAAPGDAVVVIHYFGRAQGRLLSALQGRGLTIVSDSTHLVLSAEPWLGVLRQSDFVFGSLRKSGPFPDGGFTLGRPGCSLAEPRLPARAGFWIPRAAALLSRGASMAKGYCDDENFPLFRAAEEALDASPAGAHAMCFLTRGLLEATALGPKRQRVIQNGRHLLDQVPEPLVHPLSRTGSGIYFLCRFPSPQVRDAVRANLAREAIFLPVHWDTGFLGKAHPLSGRVLSIPCDDRCSERDLDRVVAHLRGPA
jgi:hypothetical protein